MNYSRPNISVCMATYNGELYINAQIDSILKQLVEGDELIIVDDCSCDNTVRFIESYSSKYIRLYKNLKNLGHCKTFEKAISLAQKDYIFLSDQDDIWVDNRVWDMIECLEKNNSEIVYGMISDFSDSVENSIVRLPNNCCNHGYFMNLIKNIIGYKVYPVLGCAIAIKNQAKRMILPFAKNTTQHDIWIALYGFLFNKIAFLERMVLYHRLHENNVSNQNRRPIFIILISRINRLFYLFEFLLRYFR